MNVCLSFGYTLVRMNNRERFVLFSLSLCVEGEKDKRGQSFLLTLRRT